MEGENVYMISETRPVADPFFNYTDKLQRSETPLIIDNGSFQCRVGWAADASPRMVFRNLIAKNRGKKDSESQIGNDISNIEVLRWLAKSQFERNVVTQFDTQELIFDYVFSHLGVSSSGRVNHPLVITETVCNPPYSRQQMSELLFECYQIPKIAYGIDALFSFRHNCKTNPDNGLVISCGFHTVHLLPVISGKLDLPNCQRINIGGNHLANFLHRILQLKYPQHAASVTLSRAENMVHQHTYFASEYKEELESWEDVNYYNKNVHRIQLPYTQLPGARGTTSKTEWCEALVKRIQDLLIKRKMNRIISLESRLQVMTSVRELGEEQDEDLFIRALHEQGFTSPSQLHVEISRVNKIIEILKANNPGIESGSEKALNESERQLFEEIDLVNFTDPETWISSVQRKRRELLEQTQASSSEKPAPEKDLVTQTEPEKDDKLWALEEIMKEYDREFARRGINTNSTFSFNIAEYYQLHLGVERIRVPELLFQPSMIGIEQGGIADIMECILARYGREQQDLLAQNVFLTGGCAAIPGFKERVERELTAMRPFQSLNCVTLAQDPVLDAWKGARSWACGSGNLAKYAVTRAEYEEKGGEYLKEHSLSNQMYTLPQSTTNKAGQV